jgi:hypothetical protein
LVIAYAAHGDSDTDWAVVAREENPASGLE